MSDLTNAINLEGEKMSRIKIYFLLLAIFAVLSIAFIGGAIAERSIILAIVCIAGVYLSFTLARKLRDRVGPVS